MYISVVTRRNVRRDAKNRCGYCQSHQQYLLSRLEVEHIIPSSKGGSDDESNLWLACRRCNNHKSAKIDAVDPTSGQRVALFNPRMQTWSDHFRWSDSGTYVIGLTSTGRATINALELNESHAVAVRRNWVQVGWHPPT